MIAIQQLTMIHPALLSFGETVDLDLPGHLPLHVENIGSGPRGFPALAVTQYAPSVDGVVRDPEMRFELGSSRGTLQRSTPTTFAMIAPARRSSPSPKVGSITTPSPYRKKRPPFGAATSSSTGTFAHLSTNQSAPGEC